MGSRRGSVMGMYIDTSEFLNIQLVIQLPGGTSEGMQACSEFFQSDARAKEAFKIKSPESLFDSERIL